MSTAREQELEVVGCLNGGGKANVDSDRAVVGWRMAGAGLERSQEESRAECAHLLATALGHSATASHQA